MPLNLFSRRASAPRPVSVERRFVQDGFVLIEDVFSPGEIKELRSAAIKFLPEQKAPYKPQFSNTAVFEEPFRKIFQNEKLISTLRSLLGDDFTFINEFALHDSFYSGWHTDTSSPEAKGNHNFHWKPGFCIVNVAIYLNENNETGSGLDIIPGSHVRDDPTAIVLRKENGFAPDYRADYSSSDPYADCYTIPTKAGDVAIFNLRASHRSCQPKREAGNDNDRKLAIFLLAGMNNSSTARYREWADEYDAMNKTQRAEIPAEFRSYFNDLSLKLI